MFENIDVPGDVVIQRASSSLHSFKMAQVSDSVLPSNAIPSYSLQSARIPNTVKWRKPEKDIIKLNSDVSLAKTDLWGIGVVARNCEGLAMASGTWLRHGIPCATTAEAWGIYQAMVFAGDCGFSKFEFESDNGNLLRCLMDLERKIAVI